MASQRVSRKELDMTERLSFSLISKILVILFLFSLLFIVKFLYDKRISLIISIVSLSRFAYDSINILVNFPQVLKKCSLGEESR